MTFISIARLFSTVRMTQIFLVGFYFNASTNNKWTAIRPGTHFMRKRVLLQPGGSPIKWVLFKVTACLVLYISLLSSFSKGRNEPTINFVVGTYFHSLFASRLLCQNDVVCDQLWVLCAPSWKSFAHTGTRKFHYFS